MKTFKQRVTDLLNNTSNEEVKALCQNTVTSVLPDNDASLIKLTLENLSKYNGVKEVNSFINSENKIEFLNDIGLTEAFDTVFKNETLSKQNPLLMSRLIPLRTSFENKQIPAYAALEGFLVHMKPYEYLPDVSNQVKKLVELVKENEEDLTLTTVKRNLETSANRKLYSELIEKIDQYIYNRGVSVNQLLGEIKTYKFEPILNQLYEWLSRRENKHNAMSLMNENKDYNVEPICTFMYLDVNENSNTKVFCNNNIFYGVTNNELKILNESEVKALPETFLTISRYLQKPNVSVNEDSIRIKLNDNNIRFQSHPDGTKKAFLNEVEITIGDPRAFFNQSGAFDVRFNEDLLVIGKIWEHFDSLVNIDFGKNIKSKVFDGLSASLFRLDEKFYIHKSNLAMRVNEFKEGTGLQIRNEIYDFMKYDIRQQLYEFLSGDESHAAKLRLTQEDIKKAIVDLQETMNKVDKAEQYNILSNGEINSSQIRNTINEQIERLKIKYNELQSEIEHIENIQEDDGKSEASEIVTNSGKIKINDQVKVKSTGIVAKVTGINSVTHTITLITDEGQTINVHKDDIEVIKDELATQLTDMNKLAKTSSDELKASSEAEIAEDMKSFNIVPPAGADKGGKITINPKVVTDLPGSKEKTPIGDRILAHKKVADLKENMKSYNVVPLSGDKGGKITISPKVVVNPPEDQDQPALTDKILKHKPVTAIKEEETDEYISSVIKKVVEEVKKKRQCK